MNKPISMVIEDFKKNLSKTLNESQLHPSILDLILSSVAREMRELSEQQKEQERLMYEQYIELQKTELAPEAENSDMEA